MKAHHQLKHFFELDHGNRWNDIPFCSLVTWLAGRNVLIVFLELLEPTVHFLKENILGSKERRQGLLFLTDSMQRIHTLNLTLLGRGKLFLSFLSRC
jgi:hypothetical protein